VAFGFCASAGRFRSSSSPVRPWWRRSAPTPCLGREKGSRLNLGQLRRRGDHPFPPLWPKLEPLVHGGFGGNRFRWGPPGLELCLRERTGALAVRSLGYHQTAAASNLAKPASCRLAPGSFPPVLARCLLSAAASRAVPSPADTSRQALAVKPSPSLRDPEKTRFRIPRDRAAFEATDASDLLRPFFLPRAALVVMSTAWCIG
jgi:hypothetical protein